MNSPVPLVKIVLIGDMGVGKSCLLHRFLENDFVPSFTNTVGVDYKQKIFQMRGKQIKLQIFDTAGQERFYAITKAYYRGAHGVLLVYDVTAAESFENIIKWVKELEADASTANKLIVGNKCDLEELMVVPPAKATDLANKFGCKFIEASAKSGSNVEKVFMVLIEEIMKRIAPEGNTTDSPPVTVTAPEETKNGTCAC